MHWSREVEMVDSVDDLKTSRSVKGHRFPNFTMLGAKIASLKKIIQNSSSRITSYSIKVHWCYQTNLDIQQENNIDVDSEVSLSGSWFGFYQDFTVPKNRPPEGNVWAGNRLTKIQTTSRLDEFWSEIFFFWKFLNEQQGGNGIQNKPSWTLHAGWVESITLIRMSRNLTTSSKNHEENWKRIWNPPCRVQRKKTPKRGHWLIHCQPAGEDFVPNHSSKRLHAPKKRKTHSLSSQNWCIRILKMLQQWTWQTQARRAYCRPRIELYESLQFVSAADTSEGGSGPGMEQIKNSPVWQ